jgi:hypothetical protein
MLWSTSLIITLFATTICAMPDFPMKRDRVLVPRATSDPCCKSCGPIAKVLADCPPDDPDIFCGCDQWVAAAPGCEACIFDVAFNTTFAMNPGPALELFWAWCRCKNSCRSSAEALYGARCGYGTNGTCVSTTLATDGPGCQCCLEKYDPWFASFFSVWIQQAKAFLATGKASFPGMSSLHSLWTHQLIFFVQRCVRPMIMDKRFSTRFDDVLNKFARAV